MKCGIGGKVKIRTLCVWFIEGAVFHFSFVQHTSYFDGGLGADGEEVLYAATRSLVISVPSLA